MEAVQPNLQTIDFAVIVLYFLGIAWMGWCFAGDTRSSRGFLLGGGNMPIVTLAISVFMAAFSAFSMVMVPGEIFNHGLSMWVISLVSPPLTIVTCIIFMRFYFRIGAFTPFEYLERRYDRGVRTFIASLTLYLRIIYLGMVMYSTSKVFEGAAGWPAWRSILICGVVSMLLTAKGGLKAVVWSDVIQFGVMVGGLVSILVMLIHKIDGGFLTAMVYPFENGRGLDQFAKPEFFLVDPYVRLSFWLLLLGHVLGPISCMASDQMTVQRLLASGSYQKAVRTQALNACILTPALILLWVIGLAVFTFFSQHPELPVKSGDTALFTFIATQMPTPLPGLVLAAMFAATISTLNAVYSAMATVYLKEVHIRHFAPGLDEPGQVRVSRIATLLLGLIAIGLGLFIAVSADWLGQSVVEAQTIFYAFDAIVIPAFLFAALSKRASTLMVWVMAGVLWGLKLGMITWYSLSTRALVQAGQEDAPSSWAGPLSWTWTLPFLAAGLVLLAWWSRRRSARRATLALVTACLFLGYALGLAVWAFFSTKYAASEPQALSFQWVGFPTVVVFVLLGVLWFCLGKVQPPEKWRGLTLFSKDEPAAPADRNAK